MSLRDKDRRPRQGNFRKALALSLISSLAAGWLIFICGAGSARAANCYWTDNTGDHVWSTPGNWDPQRRPFSGDVLVFGDSDHDNGRNKGITIDDLPDLVLGGLVLGEDTESFDIEYTGLGELVIDGDLGVNHANADLGLFVQCPVTILNGHAIFNGNDNGSTEVIFGSDVDFANGGTIEAWATPGFITGNLSTITFNNVLSSGGDLEIDVHSGPSSLLAGSAGLVQLAEVKVNGNLTANAEGNGSMIWFYPNEPYSISGVLYLDSGDGGVFHFYNSLGGIVAPSVLVSDANTANVALDSPGAMGPGSTVTIARGAELDISSTGEPLMGTLVLENAAGDTRSSVFNGGSAEPEFFAGPILVTGDNDQVNPIIKGNILLDGTRIDVGGTGKSVLDIQASVQGSGFNKTGPGTVVLSGANNFNGPVTVSGGTVEPAKAAALNVTAGQGSLHLNGGALLVPQNLNIPNVPLYVDAPFSEVTAHTPCTWGGPVILNSTLVVAPLDLTGANAALNFSGPISGPGGLYLQAEIFGTGAVELSGPEANTFTGPITDNCQLLELNKPADVSAFGGPLIAGGPGGVGLGEVRWLKSQQAFQPNVTVYSNCFLNLTNFSQDFGAVTFNGGRIETGTGLATFYQPVVVNPVGITASINGFVEFPPPNNAFFIVGAGGVDPDLWVSASISGPSVGVSKNGPGILRFDGFNSYSGATEVNEGILEVGNPDGLGNAGNSVNVASGATLQTESGVIAGIPLTLSLRTPMTLTGGLRVPSGQSAVLTGNISLQTSTAIDVEADASLAINGAISGNGTVTKTGPGTLTFGGTSANTYKGDTQVSGGTLVLDKPPTANTPPGHLIIGSSGFHSPPSTVRLQSSLDLAAGVTVNGGGLWDLNGNVATWDSPQYQGDLPLTLINGGRVQTGTGTLVLPDGGGVEIIPGNTGFSTITGRLGLYAGTHNFDVGARSYTVAGPECTISANIEDVNISQLTKTGGGTLVLSGANNYRGNTIVSNGTVEIDGSQPQSLVQVYGGTLQGHGTVGALEMDDPNAVMDPVGIPSTFVCGNFNGGATPAGTLQIYLAGTQAGTGYSQVQAHGAVTLTDLNLDASLDFYSVPGNQFKIIENDGPQPVIGAFNGLPEGSLFPVSGELFQITYLGGASGRDVVLTDISATNQANVVTWVNGSGGDWNTAGNWNPQTVPNGGIAVVAVATSCVISNNASAALSQLFYNSPLCTITGSGSFTMAGLFNWQAGAFNGSGSLMANGGLHLNPSSGSLSLTGDSLINSGAATWSGSTAIILSGGAMLSNSVSGIFDCAGDGTIQNGPGSNLLANAGSFRKINGTGTTTIQVPFDNSGAVHVQSGTLSLAGGGSSPGRYEVSSGASLIFSAGSNTATPSSTITGAGEFHVTGGIANLFGSVTTLGAHSFSGGTINLGDNYNPANNDLSIGACTVNFNGANPVSAASLTVSGYGSLGGSSLVTVSGPMAWNSSFTIAGSNSVIANGGLTIGPGGSLFGRTLLNTVSGVWSNNGVGSLVLGMGAIFSNAPAATFDCVGNNIVEQTTGGGLVANAGLFRTIGAPATNILYVPFNNSGALEVQSGMLSLLDGGMNTGTINVFANATLSLGSGSPNQPFIQDPGASITGPGQLLVTTSLANANLGGTVHVGGGNIFDGGIANLTGNYVCSNTPLSIVGGAANFNSSNVIAPSTLTLGLYGALGGSNLVTVSGPMIWGSGSTITATGTVLANGGLTIGPGDVSLIGAVLVNLGPAVWTNNGVGSIELAGGAVLSNAPSGTFDCVGNGIIENSSGSNTVINGGLFRMIGAPATTTIRVPFINSAVVEVQSGTLSLAGGGSCIGASNSIAEIAVSAGATADFQGGVFVSDSTGIIDGAGNLLVSGGTANLGGTVDLLGSNIFSFGTANLTGDYECVSNALVIAGGTANFNGHGTVAPATLTLGLFGNLGGSNLVTVSGPMIWGSGSTITGTGSVLANGGLTIGPGGVSLIGRVLVNTGPAVWTNNGIGSIELAGSAVLSNAPSGTFDCVGSGIIENSSGSNTVINGGLFRTIGAPATTTVQVPFINNGTVELDAGTLYFQGGDYTQASGTTYLNGGNLANTSPLQIMGGVMKGSGLISGSLTNAGLLHPGSPLGQITIGGAYTQTAAGSLDIVLGGPDPLTGFNRLVVSNSAQLAGALTVSLINGFAPAAGSQFQVLSAHSPRGAFTLLKTPTGISVNYSNNGVFLVVAGSPPRPANGSGGLSLVVTGPAYSSAVLQAPRLSGGNLRFSLQTESNQSYTVQQNTDLTTTNWLFLTNFIGDGALFQFSAPPAASPQNFFRVRQP